MRAAFDAIVTAPGIGWAIPILISAPLVRWRGVRGGWWMPGAAAAPDNRDLLTNGKR